MTDGAPMTDGRAGATLQVHPASQGVAGMSDDKPAVTAKAGDEVISYWCDDAGINRRKRKAGCPSGITDRDPAIKDVPSEPRTNLRRIEVLAHRWNNAFAHHGSLTGARDGPRDTRTAGLRQVTRLSQT